MKLHKIYKVDWEDAHADVNTELDKFLVCQMGDTESIGVLVYEDDEKIIMAMERDAKDKFKNDMCGDFTMIHKGIILKYELLKEK